MTMGPYPNPNFRKQVGEKVQAALTHEHSGTLTAIEHITFGSPRFDCAIGVPFLSAGASGKDDTNDLAVELDVLVNGVTCLSTKPKIEHVSGEADMQKTTLDSTDTGVTAGVVLTTSAGMASAGDVITGTLTPTRTATPTTEMANICCVVPLIPKA